MSNPGKGSGPRTQSIPPSEYREKYDAIRWKKDEDGRNEDLHEGTDPKSGRRSSGGATEEGEGVSTKLVDVPVKYDERFQEVTCLLNEEDDSKAGKE